MKKILTMEDNMDESQGVDQHLVDLADDLWNRSAPLSLSLIFPTPIVLEMIYRSRNPHCLGLTGFLLAEAPDL